MFVATATATCAGGVAVNTAALTSDCVWYSGNACCTDAVAQAISTSVTNNACGALSTGCKDQVNLYACAVSCSPNQGEDLGKICSAFGDKVYSSCKSDSLLTTSGCQKVSTAFPDSKSFTLGALGGVYTTGTTGCFNAGSVVAPAVALIVALLALLAF